MKKYRVIWSHQSSDDLHEIYHFIYPKSKKGAEKVFDAILSLGDSLEKMPERFPVELLLENAPREYRYITKWSYKIVYTIQQKKNRVIIARIFDTRQNPEKLIIKH